MTVATTPALFAGLVDDAASLPSMSVRHGSAFAEHRRHQSAWYAGMVGLLVVRASTITDLIRAGSLDGLELVVVADTGMDRLADAVGLLADGKATVRRVEAAVAKRGEDPLPGLRRLMAVGERLPEIAVSAEIPLTWGLMEALDVVAASSEGRPGMFAKFRIGGLAAELFPAPAALAAVICACRDRKVKFSLSSGLHRAIRHNDPETGFTHHGVLNILAGCLAAAKGAAVAVVGDRIAATDAVPLVEMVRAGRDLPRPLWTGFSTWRIDEVVADLQAFGLLGPDSAASDIRPSSVHP
jgi:hypothetical protein